MKRFLLIAAAISIYCPLHAQQVTIDTMAALRATATPTTNGYEAKLRGYHVLGDNTPQTYRWNTTSTAADDGGAVINPTGHTGAGRWLLVWDGITANVRTWGASLVPSVYASDAAHDSLPAINAAINALAIQPNDHCEQPAGATTTYHTRAGTLYFPGGGINQGYVVSDEIRCTAYMRVMGDGNGVSAIGMLPGVATNPASPKYIVRFLYNNGPSATDPNQNFSTAVWGLTLIAAGNNAGSCGLKFVGCNNAYVIDVGADVAITPFVIDSKGVYFDHLTAMCVARGPGLELMGSEITGGYADIEHINGAASAKGITRDASGALYPAVWIHNAEGFTIGTIATENSPLSVRITDSQFGVINNVHANPDPASYGTVLADACIVQLDGSTDGINFPAISQGPTSGLTSVRDISAGVVNGAQVTRAVNYNPAAYRGSYYQDVNAYNMTLGALSLTGTFNLSSIGPTSHYTMMMYQYGDVGVLSFNDNQHGVQTGTLLFDTQGDINSTTPGASSLGSSVYPWKSVYSNMYYGNGAGLVNIPASSIVGLVGGSVQSQPTYYRTGSYSLQDTDRGSRQVYSAATTLQVTLGTPTASAFANGWYFFASNAGSVPATVQAPAGRTIDGQTSLSLPPRTQTIITSDGTNYFSSLASTGGERLVDFYELSADAGSITFAIPPGFHHLHLVSDCRTTATGQTVLLAQVNSDVTASHYSRNYICSAGGSVTGGVDVSNPGLCVGQMTDPTAPFAAQNDTMISLGATTPAPTKSVSAVTNGTTYSGQSMMMNNSAQWIAPGAAVTIKPGIIAARGTALRAPGVTVTSLTVMPASGNIASGSTFYLYGY